MRRNHGFSFHPLRDNVVVRRIDPDEQTPGGLYLPDKGRKWDRLAEVIAVGPGRLTDYGKFIEVDCKPGDLVLIYKGRGTEIEHEGEKALVISWLDVICKVEREEQIAKAG